MDKSGRGAVVVFKEKSFALALDSSLSGPLFHCSHRALKMIKLYGFSASNYYNKVKLALLEKGVPFSEELVWTFLPSENLKKSVLGKVPFIETERGTIVESQVILEYLEAAYGPHNGYKALLPADPYDAAKVRELCTIIDLHLEQVARRIYPQAFFGEHCSEEVIKATRKDLTKSVAGFSSLAKFSPYVAGDRLTMADCSAYASLPLISMACKAVIGEDLLEGLPIREYVARMRELASVQKIDADRKLNSIEMAKVRGQA